MRNKRTLCVYTFSHFCVDFSCFFALFSWFSSGSHPEQTVALGFLVYNIIAFGFQPVIGFLCDEHGNIPFGALGCLLLASGLLFLQTPVMAVCIMALGNACFHIEGGIDSLRYADGKMARSGVFVSTGALGVAFGTLAGKSGGLSAYYVIALLIVCMTLIFVFCRKKEEPGITRSTFYIARPELSFGAVVILSSVSIMIRSYAGVILPLAWKTTTFFFMLPAVGAFIGKASGGYLADRVGAKKIGVTSLLSAAVILTFGHTTPELYLMGIILFNMSMPITLCAVASCLPRNPGLAFGVTTLALLCGNVPTFFYPPPVYSAVFFMLAVISVMCLNYILRGGTRARKKEE